MMVSLMMHICITRSHWVDKLRSDQICVPFCRLHFHVKPSGHKSSPQSILSKVCDITLPRTGELTPYSYKRTVVKFFQHWDGTSSWSSFWSYYLSYNVNDMAAGISEWHNEPGHQQPRYWLSYPGTVRYQHQRGSMWCCIFLQEKTTLSFRWKMKTCLRNVTRFSE